MRLSVPAALFVCLFALCPSAPALAQTPAPSITPQRLTGDPPARATPTPAATPDAEAGKATDNAARDAAKPVGPRTLTTAARRAALPAEKAGPVRLPKFDKAPVIDGKLDDEIWQRAARFKDFYQVQPGDNIAPSRPSEAFIGYDSKFLYLAFKAYDDPSQVRARVAKRDGIFEDDFVGVYLDTHNDKRKAFEFFFNPLGVQADAIRTEGSGEDFSVDFVHESRGSLTADGYVVEAAIPFKSLRYTAGKDKLWGLHIFRRIQRFNQELDSWMPLSREVSGTLIQQGYLTGREGISAERPLELIPSLTLSETGKRARSFAAPAGVPDPGRMLNGPAELDPGLTVKYTITPTITLDAALNPDFAQVEADATVVTANQRFPIFFEEKRPFFLEGKDVFLTPLTVVHTRAIVDPDAAVKLTGKQGRNTFGLLVASDNAPGNYSEEDRELARNNPAVREAIGRFVDRNAQIGVLRLKRDVGRENTVGLIATSYNFVERTNQLLGLDGRFKLDPITVFSFQLIGTTSRRLFRDPDLDPLYTEDGARPFAGQQRLRDGDGFGYRWSYDRAGRHYGLNANGDGFTRDYRAEVGFTSRVDTNAVRLTPRWQSEPKPKATVVSYRFYGAFNGHWDWQGRSQRFDAQPMFSMNLQRTTYFQFGYRRAYERLFEEEFGARRGAALGPGGLPTGRVLTGAFAGEDSERSTYKHSFIAYGESTPVKQLSFYLQVVRDWNVFDFDFGSGSRYPRVSPSAVAAREARAAGQCLITEGGPAPPPVCLGLLDPGAGDLWNIQAGTTFQPSGTLRTSLDLTKQRLVRDDTNGVAFDETIVTSRTTYQFTRFTFARARVDYSALNSRLRGQFLLGWTPNPGTAFYVGYNDDMTRDGFNPFTGQLEPGFRRNGRTFFVKMSYLIRRSFGG